jgi:hypothetical protein
MNQTEPPDPTWLETLGTTGVIALVGGLLVVLLTAYCTGLATRKQDRSARYGVMVATLTSWVEMPYRVRRRLSNDQTVTQPLIDRFHDLQEQLARDTAELAAECPWLFKRHRVAADEIRDCTKPFIAEAWETEPIGVLGEMNLNGWGPTGCDAAIQAFQSELRYRFGWRRVINPIRLLRQWVRARRGQRVGRGRN